MTSLVKKADDKSLVKKLSTGFFAENRQTLLLLLVTIIIGTLFSILNPSFFSADNFLLILRQVSVIGIISVGALFIFLMRCFDLATGAACAFFGVLTAILMNKGWNGTIAILVSTAIIITISVLQGSIISTLHVDSFIITFGTMSIYRGISYVLTKGIAVYGISPKWAFIGQGYLFGTIPVPVLILIFCFILGAFILSKTKFGRRIYSVGGNEEAARLSGVNPALVKVMGYLFCGLMVSLAGLILMYRVNSGQPGGGETYNLDAISAIALGGVASTGGEGKIGGVLVGVFLIGMISNGLIIIGLNEYIQEIIKGGILIFALCSNRFTRFNNPLSSFMQLFKRPSTN